MNTANHISPEDLALFALQALTGEEQKAVVQHLEHCELCRNEVGNIQGDLVAYAMTAEMHTPPAAARERLMRRVAKEKKFIPPPPVEEVVAAEPVLASRGVPSFGQSNVEEMPVRKSGGFTAWAGWAIAAGVAVVAGLQFHSRQIVQKDLSSTQAKLTQATADSAKAQLAMDALTSTGSFQVVLHPPVGKDGKPSPSGTIGHASYDADKGALVFMASNLEPLQQYKTYELWVLPVEKGKDPIPAGTFKPDANKNATVILPELPKGVTASGFGVTIEDDGGSKTPTMPLVLSGA